MDCLNDDAGFYYWDSIGEYRSCLNGDSKLKYTNEWEPDHKYAICYKSYASQNVLDNWYPHSFLGERLSFIDEWDENTNRMPFYRIAEECDYIFIRAGKPNMDTNPFVREGPYRPTFEHLSSFDEYCIGYKEKDIDIYFRGTLYKNRKKIISEIVKIAERNNLTYDIGGIEYDHITNYKRCARSVVSLGLSGYGNRCRRDWEVLLCGSYLLRDRADSFFWGLFPTGNMSFFTGDLEEQLLNLITVRRELTDAKSEAAWRIAKTCWLGPVTLDVRVAALYTMFKCEQVQSFNHLCELEKDLVWRG